MKLTSKIVSVCAVLYDAIGNPIRSGVAVSEVAYLRLPGSNIEYAGRECCKEVKKNQGDRSPLCRIAMADHIIM